MNINVNEKERMIEIWLTNADQKDVDVMRQVDEICAKSKANNVQAVIFRSGKGDLKEGTLDLLIHNKRIQAEQMQKRKNRSNMHSDILDEWRGHAPRLRMLATLD